MPGPTILLKVVSYRDPELPRTLASAVHTADAPANLRFAVVNQVCAQTQGTLDLLEGDRRLRSVQVPWHHARGLGWARNWTDRLYDGEDFSLQIDSHMRFAPGWDTSLVEQWHAVGVPGAVLSCYPGEYRHAEAGTVELLEAVPHRIRLDRVDAEGVPHQNSGERVSGLEPTVLVSGGFQFGPGWICREVPQLPQVLRGDESVQAVRLFTHGHPVHVPRAIPLFHLYAKDKGRETHHFHDDFAADAHLREALVGMMLNSVQTVHGIFTGHRPDLLGSQRSLAEFLGAVPGLAEGLARHRPARPEVTRQLG